MFKVGEKVRYLGKSNVPVQYQYAIGIVQSQFYGEWYTVLFPDGAIANVIEDCLELYEGVNMFKVGDKVQVINNPDYLVRMYRKSVGTVENVDPRYSVGFITVRFGGMTQVVHVKDLEKVEDIMKLQLPNGLVIEGSQDQIKEVTRLLGFGHVSDSTHYYSQSKGAWVAINTMDATYARNAAIKIMRKWIDEVATYTPVKLAEALQTGCDTPTYKALVKRYASLAK